MVKIITQTNKNKGGRPKKTMTQDMFDMLIELIKIQCTKDEICQVLAMDEKTLTRRLKDRGEGGFSLLYKKHQSDGKTSLRRAQWKAAMDGNTAMLIWLGKQVLGQHDKQGIDHTSSDGSMTPHGGPPDDLVNALNGMAAKITDGASAPKMAG